MIAERQQQWILPQPQPVDVCPVVCNHVATCVAPVVVAVTCHHYVDTLVTVSSRPETHHGTVRVIPQWDHCGE